MRNTHHALLCAAVTLAASGHPAAHSQTVRLQGMLGNRALLIIDGGAPRSVPPGEAIGNVRVISTQGDQAVVSINGQRHTLRVGEAPASVGGSSSGSGSGSGTIVLSADSRGHFFAQGSINNRPVQFMVDTGASAIALGQSEADRLGLQYNTGARVRLNTANGVAEGWRLSLRAVRIGDLTVHDVDAVITPMAMPVVLLGNSFLNRFNMRRDADQMTLTRR